MKAIVCCGENARIEQIERISQSTNMSVNLRNGVSESKLSCKEGMSEGISKYEGYSNKKENGSRTSNIIEAIG